MAASAPPAAECLGVIIDLSQSHEAQLPKEQMSSLLDQTLFFLNAYSLLSASNKLVVLAPHAAGVDCLWPPPDAPLGEVAAPSNPRALRAAFLAGVESAADRWASQAGTSSSAAAAASGGRGVSSEPLLSAALSLAICRVQRMHRLDPRTEGRLLILHASPDAPAQYLACMNCVFAAQKLGMLVDTVMLSSAGGDSMVLQQASHLTGGLYLKPDAQTVRALGQYLVTSVLPNKHMRSRLQPPTQREPDPRALCFETQQPVEMGFACSVCLAVFSHDKLAVCPVCATRFAVMVPAGQARKKLKKAAAPPPAGASAAAAAAAAQPQQGAGGGAGRRVAVPQQPPPQPSSSSASGWQLEPAPTI
jgi:transcription initiation factor TFIIH subunit 3